MTEDPFSDTAPPSHSKIVKAHDHLMDATRYLVVSGQAVLRVRPGQASSPVAAAVDELGGVREDGYRRRGRGMFADLTDR